MGSNRTLRSHSTCSEAPASAGMLADPSLDASLPSLGRFGVLGTMLTQSLLGGKGCSAAVTPVPQLLQLAGRIC